MSAVPRLATAAPLVSNVGFGEARVRPDGRLSSKALCMTASAPREEYWSMCYFLGMHECAVLTVRDARTIQFHILLCKKKDKPDGSDCKPQQQAATPPHVLPHVLLAGKSMKKKHLRPNPSTSFSQDSRAWLTYFSYAARIWRMSQFGAAMDDSVVYRKCAGRRNRVPKQTASEALQ